MQLLVALQQYLVIISWILPKIRLFTTRSIVFLRKTFSATTGIDHPFSRVCLICLEYKTIIPRYTEEFILQPISSSKVAA